MCVSNCLKWRQELSFTPMRRVRGAEDKMGFSLHRDMGCPFMLVHTQVPGFSCKSILGKFFLKMGGCESEVCGAMMQDW